MSTIASSSFASSVLVKAQSTLPITSEKVIGWKCTKCDGTWKESVHKRVLYELCPNCTPHPSRKAMVIHREPDNVDDLANQLANISIHSENSTHVSRRQMADNAFIQQQMALLDGTKPVLTFHKALETNQKEMSETSDAHELAKLQFRQTTLQGQYDHKMREITPLLTPIGRVPLNMKRYNAISARLHALLSDDALDVFERLSDHAFPHNDEDIMKYRRAYHEKILICRLKFMKREYTKRQWKEAILPIYHEYEAFEIDVVMSIKIGDHVAMWINKMETTVTFDEYMWGYKLIDNIRVECNNELHNKHSELGHKYGILDDQWKHQDV